MSIYTILAIIGAVFGTASLVMTALRERKSHRLRRLQEASQKAPLMHDAEFM